MPITIIEQKHEEEHSINQDSSFDSPEIEARSQIQGDSRNSKPIGVFSTFDSTKTFKGKETKDKKEMTKESKESKEPVFKILVVDDDKFCLRQVVNMIGRILKEKSLNYDLIVEDDGIGTINRVFQDRVSGSNLIKLIISDETMNYINGSQSFGTITLLENKGVMNKLKKTLLTAIEDEGTLRFLKNVGNADEVFKKPISKKALEDLILSI